ncbi:thioesterase domain-containing protein [Streptomyces griseorubiginosus]|uniref:thioesterase II family protein n=1 Tax=Streptomyces griseorubiginosus TaxID=67304 RepID=UPI0033AE7D26
MNQYLAARPRTGTSLTLYCFHHAGAGASAFAGWARHVGPAFSVVPVRLPGRESRRAEAGITEPEVLFRDLDDSLGALLEEEPYAFYGHSLGALVAHGYTDHRLAAGGRPPRALLLGACAPPHLPNGLTDDSGPTHKGDPTHEGDPTQDGDPTHDGDLTDDRLLAALRAAGGLPADLEARPGLLRSTLATTRDDLRLCRALRERARRPVPVPVRAFAGLRDRVVAPAAVAGWQRWTTGAFRMHVLPGDHFFVREPALPRLVGQLLEPLAAAATAVPATR